MKTIVVASFIGIFSFSSIAVSDVKVRGYFNNNGTYIAPHYRSNPNKNFYDNWSTKPNINPHTGKQGTKVTPPKRKWQPRFNIRRNW